MIERGGPEGQIRTCDFIYGISLRFDMETHLGAGCFEEIVTANLYFIWQSTVRSD